MDTELLPIKNKIIKYIASESSKEEELSVLEWINQNEENKKYFDNLKSIWIASTLTQKDESFNINKSWKKIKDKGGIIVVPKHAVPGVGWAAYFKDPEGNSFGLMEEDPTAR